MTTTQQWMTLTEYLNFDDGTDTRYELEGGQLLVMPPESDRNQRIAVFLLIYFHQLGIPFHRLRIGAEVAVSGSSSTVRLPDLTILTEELAQQMEGASRATVMPDMSPPQLVVEVVSPGQKSADRDYRYKRAQYEARGISEYWIVDPIQKQVTVLSLIDSLYEASVFTGDRIIVSSELSLLDLTANKVLASGEAR